jgi:hypothetical protein
MHWKLPRELPKQFLRGTQVRVNLFDQFEAAWKV